MSAESPLRRVMQLLRMLDAERPGKTVRQLTQPLAVAQKTIRRDLESLRAVGVPILEHVADFGRKHYRIDEKRFRTPLVFCFDEALALYLGRRLLEPYAGTGLDEAAASAHRKLAAAFNPQAVAYVERLADFLHIAQPPGKYAAKREVLDNLYIALEDAKIVHITYRSQAATEPATRPVYAYALVHYRGSIYLVAFAPDHDEIRHYKLDRIEAVELTDLRFERPNSFAIGDHLADSLGVWNTPARAPGGRKTPPTLIRVRFAPAVARYVAETTAHPSQRLTPEPGGSLLAEFKLSSTEEIKAWLLSFGKHVEVVAPVALREEMRSEIAAMANAYIRRHTRKKNAR